MVKLWLPGLLLCLALGRPSSALQGTPVSPPPEYDVKAAFLYKFVPHIEWPASAFEGGRRTFRIGQIGKDVFNGALESTMKGRKAKDREVEVLNFASVDEVRSCHILFVSNLESANLEKIAAILKGAGTLVVAETPGAARRGAMINFYLDNKEVRFEVNPGAASRENLRVGANLLRLARIVKDEEK